MSYDAVDLILDKVWENHSQAFIYLSGTKTFFSINSDTHEWEMYSTENLLCIHVLNTTTEYFIDIDKITHISVI